VDNRVLLSFFSISDKKQQQQQQQPFSCWIFFLGLCFACAVVHLLTRQQVASEVSVFGSILFLHVESLICFIVTGEVIWKFCASLSLSLANLFSDYLPLCMKWFSVDCCWGASQGAKE
jgi:hypothetical protein